MISSVFLPAAGLLSAPREFMAERIFPLKLHESFNYCQSQA
jgi:hypothetical protein